MMRKTLVSAGIVTTTSTLSAPMISRWLWWSPLWQYSGGGGFGRTCLS